jgi:hypothetical protein
LTDFFNFFIKLMTNMVRIKISLTQHGSQKQNGGKIMFVAISSGPIDRFCPFFH